MRKLYLAILIGLLAVQSFAQSAGNSGLAFLKFGFGARNIAMGDAGSVAAADVTALFYNPAALSLNDDAELMFMHNEWIQDVRSEILGAKFELFGLPLAAGFNVTTVDDIEVRSKAGDLESKFNANFFFGSLSTGFHVYDDISAGVTLKYLYEGYLTDEATGIGYDFGLYYVTPLEGLTASAVIKNLGSMNKLRYEETVLPAEVRVGTLYDFDFTGSMFDLSVAAEFDKYTETDDTHFNFGAEGIYNNIFALRAGYQTGWESRGFTAGIGLMWGRLKFDYAFMPFTLGLGSSNLLSLQFRF
jgi:hypothetical protein